MKQTTSVPGELGSSLTATTEPGRVMTHFSLESSDLLQVKYSLSAEVVENTLEIYRTIEESLFVHGMPYNLLDQTDFWTQEAINRKVERNKYKTIHQFLLFQQKNPDCAYAWVKFLKWKLAAFLCINVNNTPKPVPNDLNFGHSSKRDIFFRADGLLGGVFHDSLEKFRADCKALSTVVINGKVVPATQAWGDFLATINILKKGMPRVPKQMIEDEMAETIKVLTTHFPAAQEAVVDIPLFTLELARAQEIWDAYRKQIFSIDPPVRSSSGLPFYKRRDYSRRSIETEAKDVVRELFKGSRLTRKDYYTPSFPSPSANFNSSRGAGGSVNSLLTDESLIAFQKLNSVWKENLIDTGVESCVFKNKLTERFGNLGIEEQSILDATAWKDSFEGRTNVLDVSLLEAYLIPYRDHIFDLAFNEVPQATPVALSEPFKARIITKGQPMTQYALTPIQKKLHKTLRRIPQFQYIGRPIDDEEMITFLSGNLGQNESWCSGDYKASTNYLRSWLSECIMNEIIDIWMENELKSIFSGGSQEFSMQFFDKLRALCRRALTGHIINGVPQRNGQLMGSIISFPILCIANATLCRMAINFDREQKALYPLSVLRCPMRINGDDCLLPLSENGYNYWYLITKEGGLESSVGKTYFSAHYVTLNSTLYVFCPHEGKWLRTKGVNFGILKGQARSSNKNNEVDLEKPSLKIQTPLSQLGVLLRKLKEDSPDYLWKSIKKLFIKRHFRQLSDSGVSWYLPEWAGGLGFPIDDEEEISLQDLHAASLIRQKCIKMPTLSKLKEWKMHELATKILPIKEVPYLNFEGDDFLLEDHFENAYPWLIFSTLVLSELKDLRILSDDGQLESQGLKLIKAKRNKVNKMMFKTNYELITLQELSHETKDFSIPLLLKRLDFSSLSEDLRVTTEPNCRIN
jgi:hypothetical protein